MNMDSQALAQKTAVRLGLPFVMRGKSSIDALKKRYGVSSVLVARQQALILETSGGELFFHSSMAHLRIKNLRMGKKDHMVEAMGLEAGMSVLDCTLGFGADAMVASYVAGPAGQVTGLESSPLVAAVVGYGMHYLEAENRAIHEAMRRITVHNRDYQEYLRQQSSDSIDIVYFDPMFRHPLRTSTNLDPLRSVANPDPVPAMAIAEACRVARHRVVLKENSRSLEFGRLGFQQVVGGRYSKIHYGVINVLQDR